MEAHVAIGPPEHRYSNDRQNICSDFQQKGFDKDMARGY
jgi:hypothetical protein